MFNANRVQLILVHVSLVHVTLTSPSQIHLPVVAPETPTTLEAHFALKGFLGGPLDLSLLAMYPYHVARHIWT